MSPAAGYIVQTFVALAAVCALAAIVLWGARRAGIGRPTGPIELVARLPLEARRSIYLVRVGDLVLVIGAGEGGLTKLGEVPAASLPQPSPGQTAPAAFADVLSRALGGKKGKEEG